MKNVLLLGSKSYSRQMLLREAQIPFVLIDQNVDESLCDWKLPLPQVVKQIARFKMDHLMLPQGIEDQTIFVLTADTLSQDSDGMIRGKPTDRNDAIAKIKAARDGVQLCTAFCLEKKLWNGDRWQSQGVIEQVVSSSFVFRISDEWIPIYLEKSLSMASSGAIAVEGYGAQFLCAVQGSYSTIVGLPMFELRQALQASGFF